MESQADLERRTTPMHRTLFDWDYPIWRCPACGHLNRFIAGFGEVCEECGQDATLTWQDHIVDPEVRKDWQKEEA